MWTVMWKRFGRDSAWEQHAFAHELDAEIFANVAAGSHRDVRIIDPSGQLTLHPWWSR